MAVQDTKADAVISAEKINVENPSILHRGRYNEPGTGGQDVYEAVKKAKEHMRTTGEPQGRSGNISEHQRTLENIRKNQVTSGGNRKHQETSGKSDS